MSLVRLGARRALTVSGRGGRLVRGGGGGIAPPTFARLPRETAPLAEEAELLWDDGVAPELALDMDVQEFSRAKGIAWWLGGMGFFAAVGMYIYHIRDPASCKRTSRRLMPYENLKEELPFENLPKKTILIRQPE
mmetsp:Transcript_4567/g.6812  ORF Transcript_4567/g.6812 Transcript_4567/m.6812 type:complete len:135 (+) Transcript_4567:101-505(+)